MEAIINEQNQSTENISVGSIVASNFRAANVFRKFGIDFCCGGKKSIAEVCQEKAISEQELLEELALAKASNTSAPINSHKWSPDFLCNYIKNEHHLFVLENIPFLLEISAKVARRHGEGNPNLIAIAELFQEIANELTVHMKKEEEVLFPYIAALYQSKITGQTHPKNACFTSVQSPIQIMESEHENAGELMQKIKILTNDYTPPADGCTSYKILFSKLQEFEENLHIHVHLENNILFPKAIALEKEVQ